ncbi:MAG: D-aminoacylase [Gammaproteobacteria bacterium]|nr:D-aminoacylase [Gammaproteobacteria bacterium]
MSVLPVSLQPLAASMFHWSVIRKVSRFAILLLLSCLGWACAPQSGADYDLLITNGTVYDGSGGEPFVADIAVVEDRIVAIGQLDAVAKTVLDASGHAVAPGFINMLSWANESLMIDGRSQGDIRQGVTLEVLGEGRSDGPLNEAMRRSALESGAYGGADISWTTLGEYLEALVDRGVATNVASFVGATTVRVHELGYEDREPETQELERMKALVREAMEEGAMGISSALIYAPAFYASTEELIALAKVAGEYDGLYISHLRSEGNRLLEAVGELIRIATEGELAAEIYHLKMAGQQNWDKFDAVVSKVEAARQQGLEITANMYTYTAGSTGLNAAMPPWVQEGGYQAWRQRLMDPEVRAQVLKEMTTPTDDWENLWLAAGTDSTLLVGFNNPDLRHYTGMSLDAVAAERGSSDADTIIDLVIADGSRVQAVYFMMSEENVARGIALPWVSFGSDAASMTNEGVFLERSTHPRAYGNFARVLGKYVRDDQVISLAEAIRKLSKLPASNLKIRDRGELVVGNFADIVIFDPANVTDHATYAAPHQYATGMEHVIVNGELVLYQGEHTGALPGQVVRGPGWRGWTE